MMSALAKVPLSVDAVKTARCVPPEQRTLGHKGTIDSALALCTSGDPESGDLVAFGCGLSVWRPKPRKRCC